MSKVQVGLGTIASVAWLLCVGCGDDDSSADADAGSDSGSSASRSDSNERADAGRGGKDGGAGRGGARPEAGRDAGPDEGVDGAAAQDTREITIRFRGKVGSEDLECGRSYAGQGETSTRATPTDFRFFVENVRLIASDGREVPLQLDTRAPVQNADGALIDFTDERGKCGAGTSETNTRITGRVPPGEYNGLAFTNAVPAALNHQDIALAEPPFQDGSTYWSWAQGYRFILAAITTEPDADAPDADGGSPEEFGTSIIHIGAAGCSGSNRTGYECSRPYRNDVKLEGFEPDSNVVVADLEKVFAGVDLGVPVECHGSEPRCATAYAALGLNASDGQALDTQQIYRIE